MRQAPERVAKLALLDTGARADTAEQTERRRILMAKTKAGGYRAKFPTRLSALRASRPPQRRGAEKHRARDGRGDRPRGLFAPAAGHHQPAGFTPRPGGDLVQDAGAGRARATRRRRRSWRARSRPASPARGSSSFPTAATCRRWNNRRRSTKRWSSGCSGERLGPLRRDVEGGSTSFSAVLTIAARGFARAAARDTAA